MGNLRGHVAYGASFFIIGIWHLINHIKLHAINPKSYTSLTWFPAPRIKYLELYYISTSSAITIIMALFLGQHNHQPLDTDGTIPAAHLHNFEHSVIALGLFIYALFAILLDKHAPPAKDGLTTILMSLAFVIELLIFHLHSTDHMGVEGQYHWLFQTVIFISLVTTVLSISYPKSFLISFVRSFSVVFQGVWLVNTGFMLWTPGLIPKGCYMNWENGYYIVRCHGEEALERAKSLVNIQFSWYLVGVTTLVMTLYLVMVKFYSDHQYQSLNHVQDNDIEDVESQKK